MDLTKIEVVKNITIQHLYEVSSQPTDMQLPFSQNVQIPFTPDYVIVKGINYCPASADAPDVYMLNFQNIGEIIGSFIINTVNGTPLVSSQNVSMGMIFKINSPITSDLSFNLLSDLQGATEHTIGGRLIFHLQFVKFKSEKPQRIF